MSQTALTDPESATALGPAVEITGLVKEYPAPDGGTFRAVDQLDLTVHRGEVFGILGPNGAGKTTTLEIVEGLTDRDGGTVRILGLDPQTDPAAVKERIGVQLQSSFFFELLRLSELLELFGGLYQRRLDPESLLERVDLEDKRRAQVRELSGGQAQRFAIAAALVNDPDVVFLDEPTTGLDPQARHGVWSVIRTLSREGRTVVMTTHYMEEAETLADRIAVIDRGRVVALDTPRRLIDRFGGDTTIHFSTSRPLEVTAIEQLPGLAGVQHGDGEASPSYTASIEHAGAAIPAIYQLADNHGVAIHDMTTRRSTLEDVFLNLTGRALRD